MRYSADTQDSNLEVSGQASGWGDIARNILNSIPKVNLKVYELVSNLGKTARKSVTKSIRYITKKSEEGLYDPSETRDAAQKNLYNEIIFDDKGLSTEKKDIRVTFQVSRSDIDIAEMPNYIPTTCSEFFLLRPNHRLSKEEKELLENLLFSSNFLAQLSTVKDNDVIQNPPSAPSPEGNTFYVAPRRGTSSPWSSKVQDILKDVFPSLKGWGTEGLIERGHKYVISGLEDKDIDKLKGSICDKMTQEIFSEEELNRYFVDDRKININEQAA